MDRFGRKFAMVPCFLIQAVAMAAIPPHPQLYGAASGDGASGPGQRNRLRFHDDAWRGPCARRFDRRVSGSVAPSSAKRATWGAPLVDRGHRRPARTLSLPHSQSQVSAFLPPAPSRSWYRKPSRSGRTSQTGLHVATDSTNEPTREKTRAPRGAGPKEAVPNARRRNRIRSY